MTNQEIIIKEMEARDIKEICHTYATWKSLGYIVKKGEKATFETVIWNKKKNKDKDKEVEAGFYMKKSHFFTQSQVEKI